MQIGSIHLDNPFILAPLAGYTDLAFRLLCRKFGASLCVSEMISCHGLTYKQEKTLRMLESVTEERPVAMQLFGADPKLMGEAAAIVSQYPVDLIDINMGCPVRKVIKKGAGSALMKSPELAAKIIDRVCAGSKIPVMVKFRSGWNHQQINAPAFARMAENAGVQAITVHARTWSDGFSGNADWQIIKEVKESVTVPVIGNGDILCHNDGLKMLTETGCDAVMIGRAALGAPWIFRDDQPEPTMQLRACALLEHLQLMARFTEPNRYLVKVKNHAGRYFKGIDNSASIRKQIYDTRDFAALVTLVSQFG